MKTKQPPILLPILLPALIALLLCILSLRAGEVTEETARPIITEFFYNNEYKTFSIAVWNIYPSYLSIWYCPDISFAGNEYLSKWIGTTYVNSDPILTTFPDHLVGDKGYFWVSFGWPENIHPLNDE